MKLRRIGLLAALCALAGGSAGAAPLAGLWSLRAPPGRLRWVEIHAQAGGVYHLEVLERGAADPPWQLRHLAPHLAVTGTALRASIVAPLRRGSVYPESFDSAYAQWRTLEAQGRAPVCRTSIERCLK